MEENGFSWSWYSWKVAIVLSMWQSLWIDLEDAEEQRPGPQSTSLHEPQRCSSRERFFKNPHASWRPSGYRAACKVFHKTSGTRFWVLGQNHLEGYIIKNDYILEVIPGNLPRFTSCQEEWYGQRPSLTWYRWPLSQSNLPTDCWYPKSARTWNH